MFTIFTPFFTLGPGSTTLYSPHALSQSPIFSTASTAAVELYSSLQLYSVSTVYSLYTTPLAKLIRPLGHVAVIGDVALTRGFDTSTT